MGRLYGSGTLIMGFDEIFPQEKQVVHLRFLVYEKLCRYLRRLFSANFFFNFKRLPVDSWLRGYKRFNRLSDDFHFNDDFTHCCCCRSQECARKKSSNERLMIFSMHQNLSSTCQKRGKKTANEKRVIQIPIKMFNHSSEEEWSSM